MAFRSGFADQFEQMVIVHVLDFIRKDYKLAIDLIQFAALKAISQLFATKT